MLLPFRDELPKTVSQLISHLDDPLSAVLMTWNGVNPTPHCNLLPFYLASGNRMSIALRKDTIYTDIFNH